MNQKLQFRWLDGEEAVETLNPRLAERGWALLNAQTARALAAFDAEGKLAGFFVLQLFPVLGPMEVVPDHQGGQLSRELTQRMHEFLTEVQARGYMTVCDSPVAERLAVRHGMTKLENPVYVAAGGG
jgi:hypothetical protein